MKSIPCRIQRLRAVAAGSGYIQNKKDRQQQRPRFIIMRFVAYIHFRVFTLQLLIINRRFLYYVEINLRW